MNLPSSISKSFAGFSLFVNVLCGFALPVSASDTTYRPLIEVSITPSTLIDFIPRYRFGAEVHITPHFAFNMSAGAGFEPVIAFHRLVPEHYLDYRFLELRPEIRFYYHRSYDKSAYFAIEGFSQLATMTLENDYYVPLVVTGRTDVYVLHDKADLVKRKEGWHLKTGYKVIVANLISLDFYFGLGRAWRSFDYKNIVNPRFISQDEMDLRYGPGPVRREGIKNIFHLTAGIHLDFKIMSIKKPGSQEQ